MKQKCNPLRRLLWIFVVTVLITGFYACDDDDVSSPFSLRYMEIQNIGTGMSFEASPYYSGVTPTDFTIQKVKLNGEEIETTGFTINAETGVISIVYQNQLAAGTYTLTIGCKANGSLVSFPDALTVRMLPGAPAVFKYRQPLITSEYGRFDTAYVAEISESVQIDKFIVEENGDGAYFNIDAATGTVYWKEFPIDQTPEPRHYRPAIGIVTPSGTQFYHNVLEFNITSAPMKLRYEIAEKESEKGYADTSALPVYTGSPDRLVYTVKSAKCGDVTTDKIHVTPEGRIYVDKNNQDMTQGEYIVSLTLTNQYGSKDFDNVFTWRIVNYIAPIENFSYAETTCHRLKAFDISVADNFQGDGVTFSFADPLPEALKGLTINAATGKISAPQGHKLTIGDYTIQVKAVNSKAPEGITASLVLHVTEHPNYFTLAYGNNLGLTPAENYASQYSLAKEAKVDGKAVPIDTSVLPLSAVPSNTTFRIADQYSSNSQSHSNVKDKLEVNINASTGELNIKSKGLSAGAMGFVLVEATKGQGEDAYTVKVPIFIQHRRANEPNDYYYSPFVFRVNPAKGGSSQAPVLYKNGLAEEAGNKLKIDLRDQTVYCDLREEAKYQAYSTTDGNAITKSSLLSYLWEQYGKTDHTGKHPISSIVDPGKLTAKLCYIDQTDYKVYVNPGIWKDNEGTYVNGIFWARGTYATTGADPNASNPSFPVVIWFDPEF